MSAEQMIKMVTDGKGQDMNGLASSSARSGSKGWWIPIAVSESRKAIAAGVTRHISKPVNFSNLRKVVAELLV